MSVAKLKKKAVQDRSQPKHFFGGPCGSFSGRTLSRDLILSIILAVSGVFALVVASAYGYLSHKAHVHRGDAIQSLSDHLHDPLALPLLKSDKERIQKICNAFFENALVKGLRVEDHGGTVLFEKYRDDTDRSATLQTVVRHGQMMVGTLEIALDPQIFGEKQRQLMWFSMIALAAVIMLLSVTLPIVLKVVLTIPLHRLIRRIEQISRGEYEFDDFPAPQQEIRMIVSRFNTMANRIQRRERALKALNHRLEREIVDHRNAESALLSSQEELNSIIRSTPDVIYRLDAMGRFTFVSDAIRRYGVTPDELIGQHFLDYIHEDDREAVKFRINERRTGSRSTQRLAVHAFGSYSKPDSGNPPGQASDPVFLVDAEGLYVSGEAGVKVFVGTQGIARDITTQKKAEAEKERLELKLQQAQKMEAIGTLAGGIAHDFNNILGAILGYAQLTHMNSVDNPQVQEYVSNIFKAGERARGLVEQILIFTRQGKSEKVPCDIAMIVKEVVKLLRASIPSTIEIVKRVPANLGTVMADQTQIHQVLMNLCTNAAHAMETSGGRLMVSLEICSMDESYLIAGDDLASGPYLQLSVGDTGTGMEKSVVDRIFEPYFTTKPVGEGTGMGLATVHGIVNDHGGRIFVDSEPGQGSVFRILFPVLKNTAEAAINQPAACLHGSECVLFVDDEEILVHVSVEMLRKLGYDAVGTTSAMQALEMFKARRDDFDLVITDMTMPSMTGDQLAAQLLSQRPDLPIIICTGFSKRLNEELSYAMGIRALLMKPVTIHDLSRTIRDVLDAPDDCRVAQLVD